MKKITDEDKVTLEIISNEDGEKMFKEINNIIKRAYDDLNMVYDIYAFEKVSAKIVKIFDTHLVDNKATV